MNLPDAFYIAENDFSADIGFPAMEAMNTKVMGIIERSNPAEIMAKFR